jgi:hypothetical protein
MSSACVQQTPDESISTGSNYTGDREVVGTKRRWSKLPVCEFALGTRAQGRGPG